MKAPCDRPELGRSPTLTGVTEQDLGYRPRQALPPDLEQLWDLVTENRAKH